MYDADAWAVLLMRDKAFSQFGLHCVLNVCLERETVDGVLIRNILENAVPRVCLCLQLVTSAGLADLYDSDKRRVAINETELYHAAMCWQVTCFPPELLLLSISGPSVWIRSQLIAGDEISAVCCFYEYARTLNWIP
jgi:hypothetical protein